MCDVSALLVPNWPVAPRELYSHACMAMGCIGTYQPVMGRQTLGFGGGVSYHSMLSMEYLAWLKCACERWGGGDARAECSSWCE